MEPMTGLLANDGQRHPSVPVSEPPTVPRTTPDPAPSAPEERDPSPGTPAQREPPDKCQRQQKSASLENAGSTCR